MCSLSMFYTGLAAGKAKASLTESTALDILSFLGWGCVLMSAQSHCEVELLKTAYPTGTWINKMALSYSIKLSRSYLTN